MCYVLRIYYHINENVIYSKLKILYKKKERKQNNIKKRWKGRKAGLYGGGCSWGGSGAVGGCCVIVTVIVVHL